jgi:MOSC domain-containing protein YiiM
VPSVVSVNLAEPRTLVRRGRNVTTGLWKLPAAGPVELRPDGVAGDLVGDRRIHGGAEKAAYAYAREDIDWWERELGLELPNGVFGENLTLAGIDLTGALIGERWRVGGALVEVSEPRYPCWKLGVKFDDPRFLKRFTAAGRPGAYLRVIEAGAVAAGDPAELAARPGRGVTIGRTALERAA